jgi:hypothetical protein
VELGFRFSAEIDSNRLKKAVTNIDIEITGPPALLQISFAGCRALKNHRLKFRSTK